MTNECTFNLNEGIKVKVFETQLSYSSKNVFLHNNNYSSLKIFLK